jgi:hypothetical protein
MDTEILLLQVNEQECETLQSPSTNDLVKDVCGVTSPLLVYLNVMFNKSMDYANVTVNFFYALNFYTGQVFFPR